MKKIDLKLGDVVKVRNGEFYLLIEKDYKWIFVNYNGYLNLDDYKSDLTMIRPSDSDYDIIAIYESISYNLRDVFSKIYLKIKKLREEQLDQYEITMEDIANKFNIPMDRIKIKN